jgi:prepilin-type processing-associated H-X9-DG protein
MKACFMYTSDNYDLLPPNPDDGNTDPGYAWVGGSVTGWMPYYAGGDPNAGNPDLLRNPATSLLAIYIGNNVAIFKCPADPRVCQYAGLDPSQRGTKIPVVRSISCNQGVGTADASWLNGGSHRGKPLLPVNGPWLTGNHGDNKSGRPYLTFGRLTDFKSASPSDIWTYVDDDPWTINDAAMAVIAAEPQFVDYCSPMHDNGCGFAFADGHSEMHHWKSRLFIHNESPPRTTAIGTLELADWFWWAWHASRSTVTSTVP